ncbi:MAG: protein arginine kinase [Candidatus Eisenbacteria bacterium]|nr:protein arginine kinase [Candidatus Eisenbacteria bacterium]
MPIRDLIQGPIRWLEGSAPKNDRVLSTRIRLARNVAGVRFVGKALPGELEGLRERAFESAGQVSSFRGAAKVRMEELPLLDRQFLLERHLVSHDLTGEAQARGLVLDPEEKLSLLVNEEDHLRIQALYPGFQLEEAFERARIADQELESKLQYAIHPELGYLTACPTNVGTGMRASVLVHLPGLVLSQRIKKILTGIQQVGLTVRGFYGEGSEVVGNFFQISNQVTLGESEEETLGKLEQAIGQLLEWENRSQEGLLRDAGLQVEDKILRALGTLKYSRLLGSQELIGLLSAVRFGHTLGMRNVPSIAVLNDLLLKGQPAHLQRIAGREMSSEERNAFRAARVQKALGVEDVPSLQG